MKRKKEEQKKLIAIAITMFRTESPEI